MAYNDKITTSKHGRRLGLQALSTAQSGGSRHEFLVGPDDFRVGVTTAETTDVDLKPYGISIDLGTSAGSSAVYTLEAPVPGVRKVLASSTANGPVYVYLGDAQITSSAGSTHSVVKLSTLGHPIELVGVTTDTWLTFATTASGHSFAGTT